MEKVSFVNFLWYTDVKAKKEKAIHEEKTKSAKRNRRKS